MLSVASNLFEGSSSSLGIGIQVCLLIVIQNFSLLQHRQISRLRRMDISSRDLWQPLYTCRLTFYGNFVYFIVGTYVVFLQTSFINLCLQVKIAMVGKYTGLSDSYLSVIKVEPTWCMVDHYTLVPNVMCYLGDDLFPISFLKALLHASIDCSRKLCIKWVAATDLEDETRDEVSYLEGETSVPKEFQHWLHAIFFCAESCSAYCSLGSA